MAKQSGIHQLRGKVGNMKYYGMKGVKGGLVQSINEGMSERVKTDAAYANTRLNNAEFGGAGSTAGAIIRSLSQRWRYLLVPFATGKLAKDVRNIMMQDTGGAWGERGLIGASWQKGLAEKVTAYSKNPSDDFSGLTIGCNFDSDAGMSLDITSTTDFHNDRLEALGCTGVRVVTLAGAVETSAYDDGVHQYIPAVSDFKVGDTHDFDFANASTASAQRADIKSASQEDNRLYGGLVVLLPYKTVNNVKYIMQELCSFVMVAAE